MNGGSGRPGRCEVPAGLDRPPVAGVEGLDGVGGADDAADLHVVVQERHELGPRVLPQPGDRRLLPAPLAGELGEPFIPWPRPRSVR